MDVNFLDSHEFEPFCDVLDGELKRFNATGKYIHKKAEVITQEWQNLVAEESIRRQWTPGFS